MKVQREAVLVAGWFVVVSAIVLGHWLLFEADFSPPDETRPSLRTYQRVNDELDRLTHVDGGGWHRWP